MLTPQTFQPKLAQALGVTSLYFKREDLHPYGSHKGRSIPAIIEAYRKQGVKNFVISSSGNAALAAIHAIRQNETLTIFVGKNIDTDKLKMLHATCDVLTGITIKQTTNPKQQAFQMDKIGQAKNLRQSTDDLALIGYGLLAIELNGIPNLQTVFIPTSSGTTAQALGEWFAVHNPAVQIHIVQTESCHPIGEVFDKPLPHPPLPGEEKIKSIASAIVDRVAHRKAKVVEIINQSNGSGWIVSDEEIQHAVRITKETTGIDISPNSALSVAGLKKAIDFGRQLTGVVVCLITGA